MLLEESGVQQDELGTIVIAGAFGYYLRRQAMETIGIIPKGFAGKVVFAGNTSRTGCAMMLVDATLRKTLEHWMHRVTLCLLPRGRVSETIHHKSIPVEIISRKATVLSISRDFFLFYARATCLIAGPL